MISESYTTTSNKTLHTMLTMAKACGGMETLSNGTGKNFISALFIWLAKFVPLYLVQLDVGIAP